IAKTYHSLGVALQLKMDFSGAVLAYEKALAIDPKFSEAQRNLLGCRLLAKTDAELSSILKGETKAASADEQIRLAVFCARYRKLYASAARLYASAFQASPERTRHGENRFHAACCAAMAAAGNGADASKLNLDERTRLRKQARDWLQAELDFLD